MNATARRMDDVPAPMRAAVESVRRMPRIAGVRYRELPVPERLCDYGIGVELACPRDVAGWIMVLYDRVPREAWHSSWRCVGYVDMPLGVGESAELAAQMMWDDAREALDGGGCAMDGTVTVSRSTGFGALRGESAGCQLRVSWTPDTMDEECDAGSQILAWARFMTSLTR